MKDAPISMKPNQKVVCICRGGQVRSVSARFILSDMFGFRKVLVCGWDKNDLETVDMLCDWADVVLVVGSADKWTTVPSNRFHYKTIRLNIGEDRFGHYQHPELVQILVALIRPLIQL